MMVFISVSLLVWCWQRPNALYRLRRHNPADSERTQLPLPTVVAILWPVAGFLFFGFVGLAITLATIPFARGAVLKLENRADQQRTLRINADLPVTLGLIAAVVKAGRSTESAIGVVAKRVPEPIASELHQVVQQLERSADSRNVWWRLSDSFLGKTARVFARSADSGSSVVTTVMHAADEVRSDREETQRLAANRVAVKTAAPLGLCFLPAFLLMGIVPMVLGISSGILGS